jgi:hypothetical protein
VPDEDAVTVDHNSYRRRTVDGLFRAVRDRVAAAGRDWMHSEEHAKAVQAIHRHFYEHRSTFHLFPGGHSGEMDPILSPPLAGSGRTRRVASWEDFDRVFGPLCDGSAFAGSRRGARPVEGLYLPISPEWPARYLYYGQPGYEAEFVNVVGQMEKHFREKGWTKTRFEMFFNHKKRYMGFEWDGDETRFPKDNECYRYYGRLLKKSVPAGSPVRFRFRADASWLMRRQFDDLAGVVDFWVCSAGIFSFYPEAPALLKKRGDLLWLYGGLASAQQPLIGVIETPLRTWMLGAKGVVYWLTTSQGWDPWFGFDGGRHCMIYSGHRFGVAEPLAPMRLKVQRNFLQDLALLEQIGKRIGEDAVREKVASLCGHKLADFWHPDAPIKKLDPWEWTNNTIHRGVRTISPAHQRGAAWWIKVRQYALSASKTPGRQPQ